MVGIKVVSTGHAVPDKVVTNDDLSRVVDTNDEWIYSKTGIKERHFCENETNWELALKAADTAIERAGIDKSEIESQHHFFRTVKRDMLLLLEANRFPPVLTWRTEIHVCFLAMEQELPL
ncbi:MAG: hypothetical protein KH378_08830 [Butyrivibrio sp.]|nr:hypothetical protein [Butyrivibrio sp.]